MRVLITTFGSLGDLVPYLALARGLAARGHEPVIGTHELFRGAVEAEGHAFRPVRPDSDPDERKRFLHAEGPRRGPMLLLRKVLLSRVGESYEDTRDAAEQADLIVTHPLTFAGPLVAQRRGLPWVSSVLAPLTFFSRHDFPVVPFLPRARRLQRVPGMPALLGRRFRAVTRSWTEPVRTLRAELDLPPAGHPLFEGQHSPLLTLALFSPVLASPQPDWPRSARITGFPFGVGSGGAGVGPELGAFLSDGPPPLVFTLGSSKVVEVGAFYEESLAAARSLGMRAVLIVGDDRGTLPPSAPGGDAIVVERVPHAGLFPRAAAIVHHGGIGTLGEALRAGRPMLVVPWSHDQPDNARRVERLGIAATLPPRRYDAARAARAIEGLLGDPAIAARASRIAAVVRAEDGVRTACDAIEDAALAPRAPAAGRGPCGGTGDFVP